MAELSSCDSASDGILTGSRIPAAANYSQLQSVRGSYSHSQLQQATVGYSPSQLQSESATVRVSYSKLQ